MGKSDRVLNGESKDSKSKNKYEDYLPQNRFKKEAGVSPRVMKYGLFAFYFLIFGVCIGFGLRFNGYDVLKVESREYNMNLSETINLDTVYMSSNVVWESNSDSVVIDDNVVTAVGSGTAYIIGREGDKQVSDLFVSVLSDDNELYVDNHSIQLDVNDTQKINVIQNNSISIDSSDDEDLDDDTETVTDEEESVNSGSLTYESSDESIAKVDNDGNITPVSEGTVVVTVEDDDGNKDHTYVTVTTDVFKLYNMEYSMNVGDVNTINYTLDINKYSSSDIVWTSEDTGVVTVDGGVLTAVGVGETYVSIKIGDVVSERIKVSVLSDSILPVDLMLSQTSLSINAGDSVYVTADVSPDTATNRSVFWKSDNSNVATVLDGNIVGVSSGTTKIYATTSNGITKQIDVIVSKRVVEATDITLTSVKSTLNVGESTNISYVITPEATTDKNVTYKYDKNYVSLDNNGMLTALKAGTTQIVATTSNGISSTLTITIVSGSSVSNVSDIRINEGNLSLTVGSKKNLSVTLNPSNLSGKVVKWTSSNSGVVSVDSNGMISAVREGSATITASCDGVSNSITISVVSSVVNVSSLSLNKTSLDLKTGKTGQLKVSVSPSNATNKSVKWSSSNKKVATVDSSGKVTAVSKGSATISAVSSENSSIKVTAKVKVTYDVKISLSASSKSLTLGKSFDLDASISPSGASKKVTWKSSNKKIATVDSNGKVTAKGVGTVTITATSKEDSSKSKNCKVTVKDVYTGKMTNPCPGATVSSMYGKRKAPCSGCSTYHRGIDLAASTGTIVIAADGGTVTKIDYSSARGNYIEITHKKGLITRYQHLSKVLVKKGDLVEKKDKIGKVGSTGNVTGPHLHFEVEVNGSTKNPCGYYKFSKC